MSRLLQDLRYAFRTLRKTPLFTTIAMLTLALGIGANSAIFTLINAALLRPLPFAEPDRLALVWEDTSMFGLKDSPVAYGNYAEWRARNHVFSEMGALEQNGFILSGKTEAQVVRGCVVTASFFRTLGVQPALGRLFRDEEDHSGAPKTVVVSDSLWRRELGGDPAAVGRTIELNREKFVVAGVLPAGFRFLSARNEIWAPTGAFFSEWELQNKGRHNAMVVARLKPGITLAQASREIGGIARALEREFPDTNGRVGAFAAPLREHFVSGARTMLAVLGVAVGFVLLIACANLANLLLSRASNRSREIAIRTAIGASRGRVLRQLLTESALLSTGGGAVGLALAAFGAQFLGKLLPADIASMSATAVDWRVTGFTLAVSMMTGIAFGLAPAAATLRADLQSALKQGGARQGTSRGGRALRNGLVITEVALAFVLAVGATLFVQSFARLRGMDLGFQAEHLLTMRIAVPYDGAQRRAAFYDQALTRIRSLPGVVAAGFSNGLPVLMKGNINGFAIEGRPAMSGNTFSNANYRVVTEDYLRTIGLPLRDGRLLDRHDTADAPPVLLINEAMRQKFWAGESPVGKRLRFSAQRPWVTIVGVVGNMRQSGPAAAPSPEMYLPVAQEPTRLSGLAIRTAGDPASLAEAARRELRALDRDVPVMDVATMDQVLDREVFQRRAQTTLLGSMAGIAVLLSALGIYGVLACVVAQRRQEIGVRIALGATQRDVLWTVARQSAALSGAGLAIGAAAALGLTQMASGLLFGIAPRDPATFAGVAAALAMTAAAASIVPARRAMKVDPIVALREE